MKFPPGPSEFAESPRKVARPMIGVQTARTWQDPEAGAGELLFLKPGLRAWPLECRSVRSDSDDGDELRVVATHGALQSAAPGAKFRGTQFRGGGRAARDEIRDAAAIFQQFVLFPWREQSRSETGRVKRRPEPVARPCKVMPRRGRIQARIDPAKQKLEIGRDEIANRPAVCGLQVSWSWSVVRHRT